MKVIYSSNNSGGSWSLNDEDWYALQEADWEVKWVADNPPRLKGGLSEDGDRWLGALATSASKDFDDPQDALTEFENITGQDLTNQGCGCCGPPHSFSWVDEDGHPHFSYAEIERTNIKFS